MAGQTSENLSPLHVFCRVLELASFRQAADSLHMPVATVSSQIKTLEQRLGVVLLRRSSRHVEPTEEGMAYYRRVLPLLEGLDEAAQMLKDTQMRPAGRLHVSMPASVMRLMVAPHLHDFANRYPEISLRVIATDRVLDLGAEGLDCAIRASAPANDGLVFEAITRLPQFFAASPDLLGRFGTPKTLDELARLPFINYSASPDSARLQVRASKTHGADIERSQFSATASLSIDDGSAYVSLACAAMGVIQSPAYDLNPELATGRLQLLLPQWRGPEIAFHAVYAKGRANLPRVTAFVDWVCDVLRREEFAVPLDRT